MVFTGLCPISASKPDTQKRKQVRVCVSNRLFVTRLVVMISSRALPRGIKRGFTTRVWHNNTVDVGVSSNFSSREKVQNNSPSSRQIHGNNSLGLITILIIHRLSFSTSSFTCNQIYPNCYFLTTFTVRRKTNQWGPTFESLWRFEPTLRVVLDSYWIKYLY